ncbi:MAG: ExbD/TolR family protein [Polyangiales bacterium]
MAKLTAKQRAFVRARSKVAPAEHLDDELNIVPFLDIVINLIMFLLMVTASITSYTQVATAMPDHTPSVSPGPEPESLRLSVVLTEFGIHVSTSGAQLSADCVTPGVPGEATIPTQFGAFDWEALSECAERARREAESTGVEFRNAAGLGEVTLTADSLVEYQNVIHAMDALRERDGRSLFPAVLLSAGVR